MSVYRKTRQVQATVTPQSQPIKGFEKEMVLNAAGGYAFTISDKLQLERFLILGTSAGTYYAKPQDLTDKNEKMIRRLLASDPDYVLSEIQRVSVDGLALRNDPALFALALATTTGKESITRRAMELLPLVARTGTDILHFTSFMFGDHKDGRRGIGRAIRKGYGNWFTSKSDKEVVFQTMKYQNRDSWTMGDVISITHLKPWNSVMENHFKLLLGKTDPDKNKFSPDNLIGLAEFAHRIKGITNINKVTELVVEYNAPHELWPTEMKNKPDIWAAVLMDGLLPMRAMLRNLVNMSQYGVFSTGATIKSFCDRVTNEDILSRSRIHPLAIYQALGKYGTGGDSKRAWPVNGKITQSLEDAMNLSFKFLKPTGKKYLLAVDSSGSMSAPVFEGKPSASLFDGTPSKTLDMSARTIAMICALSVMKAEGKENVRIIGFNSHVTTPHIDPDMGIVNAARAIYDAPNSTDCSLPIKFALDNNLNVDMIAFFTDNETWAGNEHAAETMARYRQIYGDNKKWISCALTATDSSIVPENDLYGLNIVGASPDVPLVIQKFAGANVEVVQDEE